MLQVKGIKKAFGDCNVLKDVTFDLKQGEIMAVIGQSGAGKTTLLRCINGLEQCDSGSIAIDNMYLCKEENNKVSYAKGAELRLIRSKIGMVFQSLNLFPHMTVLQNVIDAPVNICKMSYKEAEAKAFDILDSLEIRDKAECYPYQLSGGQKQRVAIARACILSPKVMCFDEPTSALDPELRESIALIMEKMAKENMAVLIITHDMSFARRVADRLIYMESGQIIQAGNKKDFFANASNDKIKRFIQNL